MAEVRDAIVLRSRAFEEAMHQRCWNDVGPRYHRLDISILRAGAWTVRSVLAMRLSSTATRLGTLRQRSIPQGLASQHCEAGIIKLLLRSPCIMDNLQNQTIVVARSSAPFWDSCKDIAYGTILQLGLRRLSVLCNINCTRYDCICWCLKQSSSSSMNQDQKIGVNPAFARISDSLRVEANNAEIDILLSLLPLLHELEGQISSNEASKRIVANRLVKTSSMMRCVADL
jgi:hypothetical protein